MLTLLGERWRTTAVGEEACVTSATATTVGRQPAVAVLREIGQQLAAVHVADDGSLGDLHLELGSALAVLVLAHAVHAVAGDAVRVIAEGEQ